MSLRGWILKFKQSGGYTNPDVSPFRCVHMMLLTLVTYNMCVDVSKESFWSLLADFLYSFQVYYIYFRIPKYCRVYCNVQCTVLYLLWANSVCPLGSSHGEVWQVTGVRLWQPIYLGFFTVWPDNTLQYWQIMLVHSGIQSTGTVYC